MGATVLFSGGRRGEFTCSFDRALRQYLEVRREALLCSTCMQCQRVAGGAKEGWNASAAAV